MKKVLPSAVMEKEFLTLAGQKAPLSEAVRLAAQLMLQKAVELERLFGEGRRRSKIVPRFMSESSGMSLLFAVLVDASASWRGVKITAEVQKQLKVLRTNEDENLKAITQKAA